MSFVEKIEALENWLSINRRVLEEVIANPGHAATEQIIRGMDQHILAFGKLKWELDNPTEGKYKLLISPNNDSELLQITKNIIYSLPEWDNWTFYAAIPPNGKVNVSLYDNLMDLQEVDASEWKCQLLADDDKFELVLEADNTDHLDEDTQWVAADLILNQLIGEECKILKLSGLEITTAFETDSRGNEFPIAELAEKLSSN